MTAHAFTDADPLPAPPEVWDAQRLTGLIADVGETGLRDILRLFQADLPFLQAQLTAAIATGNAQAARAILATVQDAAANLGLAALACTAKALRDDPLTSATGMLLEQEIARVRFVPHLKQAS